MMVLNERFLWIGVSPNFIEKYIINYDKLVRITINQYLFFLIL